MARPVVLAAARVAPVASVVDAAKDLLRMAESGELRGFIASMQVIGRKDGFWYVPGDADACVLNIGLDRAKLRMMQSREEEG